jgi:hypothetical protein
MNIPRLITPIAMTAAFGLGWSQGASAQSWIEKARPRLAESEQACGQFPQMSDYGFRDLSSFETAGKRAEVILWQRERDTWMRCAKEAREVKEAQQQQRTQTLPANKKAGGNTALYMNYIIVGNKKECI